MIKYLICAGLFAGGFYLGRRSVSAADFLEGGASS